VASFENAVLATVDMGMGLPFLQGVLELPCSPSVSVLILAASVMPVLRPLLLHGLFSRQLCFLSLRSIDTLCSDDLA
jgi:hypothetical protein